MATMVALMALLVPFQVPKEPAKDQFIDKGPARFETGATASRFEVALAEGFGKVDLGLHYGDRTLALTFTR